MEKIDRIESIDTAGKSHLRYVYRERQIDQIERIDIFEMQFSI